MQSDFRVKEIFTDSNGDVIALCHDVLYGEDFEKFLGQGDDLIGKENASNLLNNSNFEIPPYIRADIEDIFGVVEFNDMKNGSYDNDIDEIIYAGNANGIVTEEELDAQCDMGGKFNLREALNRIDLITNNKYDLRNLYESCNLSEDEKEILATLVYDQEDPSVIYDTLNNRFLDNETKLSENVKGKITPEDLEDIEFVMDYYMPDLIISYIAPGKYEACYKGNDSTSVIVEFDPSYAEFVYTIDGEGPYSHASYEYIQGDIERALDNKLLKNESKSIEESSDNGYWYFTKHGIQPGSIPKGANVLMIQDVENGTYVKLDRVLTTKELNDYEIIEKSPEELYESNSESKSIDDILNILGGHTNFYRFLKDTIKAYPGIEGNIDEIVSIIWDEDMGVDKNELTSAIEYIIDDVLNESIDDVVTSTIDNSKLLINEKNVIPGTHSFKATYTTGSSKGTTRVFVKADDEGTEYLKTLGFKPEVFNGDEFIDLPTECLKGNGFEGSFYITENDFSEYNDLKESLNENVGKTFAQWFDETQQYGDDEEFYPFNNYVKQFPNAEVLRDVTAKDIVVNAHKFDDTYHVDSDDRMKAFIFASEELGIDEDRLYRAWLHEEPIEGNKTSESLIESSDETWHDVYEQFLDIVDSTYIGGNEEEISKAVEELYRQHDGEPAWDEAWLRWLDHTLEPGDEGFEEADALYKSERERINNRRFNGPQGNKINEAAYADKPSSKEDLELDLKISTKDFTNRQGNVKFNFKEEADIGYEILKQYYDEVEVEENGEWFHLTYSNKLEEDIDAMQKLHLIQQAVVSLWEMDNFVMSLYDNEGWLMNGVPDGEFDESTKEEVIQNFKDHTWLIEDENDSIDLDEFKEFVDTFKSVTKYSGYDQEKRAAIISDAEKILM